MLLATHEVVTEAIAMTINVQDGTVLMTPEQLANVVSEFASSDEWLDRVRLRSQGRWYERLYVGPTYDIWAIAWMPGQSTGFHDHGGSSGAFIVKTGALEEHRPGEATLTVRSGQPRAFGPDYAHDVRNASSAPAISIHAYSPPLSDMNEYELDGDQLVPLEKTEKLDQAVRSQEAEGIKRTALSIEQMLAEARTRLERLSPEKAYRAVIDVGAILVDIRPDGQRATEGSIPGALVIERNVLEWRLDPASDARLSMASNHNLHVIVFCSEGYTSSLAAAALQDLGLWRATDVVGGFHAWKEMGLPHVSPSDVHSGQVH
jgi:rhodanese-related sulfurtransferase/predicted metal-dependent enzyme (double-stranded beta helix superfamily)